MIRLTMGRKEKKERKKVRREEMSNLGAIAGGLGGMVAGVGEAFGGGGANDGEDDAGAGFKRVGMRKRKVEVLEQGRKRGGQKSTKKAPSNTYQKSLYGSSRGGSGGGRKSRSRK